MQDNRKVAVAFGSFACVVEGYDNPFKVIQRVVRYFKDLEAKDPNFGNWSELPNLDDLRARMEELGDGPIEIDTLPGGVRVRRLIDTQMPVADAPFGVASPAAPDRPDDADTSGDAESGEHTEHEPADDPAFADIEVGAEPVAEANPAAETEVFAAGDPIGDVPDPLSMSSDMEDAQSSDVDRTTDFEPEGLDAFSADADSAATDETTSEPAAEMAEATEPLTTAAFDDGNDEPAAEAPASDFADLAEDRDALIASLTSDISDLEPLADDFEPAPEDIATPDITEDVAPLADLSDEIRFNETAEENETPAAEPPAADSDVDDLAADFISSLSLPEDEPEEAAEPVEAASEDAPTDEGSAADQEPAADEIAAAVQAQLQAEDDPAPTEEPPAKPTAPLRLGEAPTADTPSGTAPLRLTPEAAPLRLGEPAPDEEEAAQAKPMPLGRPLFGRAKSEDGDAVAHQSDAPTPPPPNQDLGAGFIDSLTSRDAPEKPAKAPAPVPQDQEIAAELSGAVTPDDTANRPRGLGSFLRRKPETDAEAAPSADSGPRLVTSEEDAAAAAAPARKPGGVLRVVAETQDDGAGSPEPETAEAEQPAKSGLRSFLRGKAEPQSETEPEAAPAEPPTRKPQSSDDADPLKDRLHASFSDAPEPAAANTFELDAEDTEEVDAFSPLGFAKHAGAASLPELMTAATAYLNIVEQKGTVSRNEILDVVQQIAGDTPLTAEAKVKAVGKLVRSGTLVRLDGGQFMLDEVEAQKFRDRLDGAA